MSWTHCGQESTAGSRVPQHRDHQCLECGTRSVPGRALEVQAGVDDEGGVKGSSNLFVAAILAVVGIVSERLHTPKAPGESVISPESSIISLSRLRTSLGKWRDAISRSMPQGIQAAMEIPSALPVVRITAI